jgi:hypothetical protein
VGRISCLRHHYYACRLSWSWVVLFCWDHSVLVRPILVLHSWVVLLSSWVLVKLFGCYWRWCWLIWLLLSLKVLLVLDVVGLETSRHLLGHLMTFSCILRGNSSVLNTTVWSNGITSIRNCASGLFSLYKLVFMFLHVEDVSCASWREEFSFNFWRQLVLIFLS